MSTVRRRSLLALASALCGCAGYRGGWESIPYVGEAPPVLDSSRTAYEAQKRREIVLEGVTLGVSINNPLRAYDTQVYLFVLPLSVDPRAVQVQPVEPGKTRVTLRISGMTADWTLRPRKARLAVGSQIVEAAAASQFAMWDAQGQEVSSGGRWGHQALGDEVVLAKRAQAYLVDLDFPAPLPSPQADNISLDLADALSSPELPRPPKIRFAPVRWKEGYT